MASRKEVLGKIIATIPHLGSLRGCEGTTAWTGRKFFQFLGVKYAEAPIGKLRFKKPVPIAPWTGIKDATEYGRTFPSASFYQNIPDEDKFNPELEDCLSLCVFSPDLKGKLPIMVYIHGGSFREGGAPHHPPNYLLEKDIVLVVPQYRLGPLGFLCTMTETIPGNAAIFDLILALEWVQKNIKYFGGDSNKVTVFGQSAGAVLASYLSMSPLVREDLLHGVILQSGGAFCSWSTFEDPIGDARKTAINSGKCTEDSTIEEVEKCLMEMDVKTLFHCAKGTRNRPILDCPSGLLCPPRDDVYINNRCRKNLPMIMGVTKNDAGYNFMLFYDFIENTYGLSNKHYNIFKLIETQLFIAGFESNFSDVTGMLGFLVKNFLWDEETIMRGDLIEMLPGMIDIGNVFGFKAPILKQAMLNASVNPKNTWLYTFDYEGEHTRHGYGEDTSKYPFKGGVAHSDDNIYLFPWPKEVANLNERDTKMAKKMVDLWTSFAINGVPASPDVCTWPSMENLTGPYLHIDEECSVGKTFYDEFKVVSKDKKILKKKHEL